MKMPSHLPSRSAGASRHDPAVPSGTRADTGGTPDANAESVLERLYPGVVRALTLMWGHPELTEFLDRVAAGLDERLRDIEPAAMAELMLLGQLHRSFCPRRALHLHQGHPAARGTGGWRPALHRG